jgi:hypothetical protein
MEDSGLEPLTFWLPASEKLLASLLFPKVYGLHKKPFTGTFSVNSQKVQKHESKYKLAQNCDT